MDRDEVEGIGVDGNNDENEEWRRMIQAGQVGEVRKVERNAEVAVRANDILIGMVKSEGRKGEEGGPISMNPNFAVESQVIEMQKSILSQKSSLFSLLLLRSIRKFIHYRSFTTAANCPKLLVSLIIEIELILQQAIPT